MKVLITGANGQLGQQLQRTKPKHITLLTTDQNSLDITQSEQVSAYLIKHQPQVIINTAAYTAVDKAESDSEQAYAINHLALETLAREAANRSIYLLQVSTDFVFDGTQSTPYLPNARPNPLSVYGESKLAGEQVIQEYCKSACIVRTSWLYSVYGNNFVKTMLRLMAERDTLSVVADQVGSPTWAQTLALTLWHFVNTQPNGIYHCADNGVASWYDFAVAIQEQALQAGLLTKAIPLKPIRTQDYPTPARRPAYSVLDKQTTEQHLGYLLPYWRNSLHHMLQDYTQTMQVA